MEKHCMPLMVVNVSSIHRLPGDLNDLQANHEEADTLTAFHLKNTSGNRIILRASDILILMPSSYLSVYLEINARK